MGYETRKAAAVIDSLTTVEAWYAPKLAFKNGPEYFNGLPGLILEVSKINKTPDGEYESSKTFLATSLKTEKNQKIEKPKKGKNITKEEYDGLVKENRERMNEMRGGGVDVD